MVSEEIKRFLDFVEDSKKLHSVYQEALVREDKKVQDFLHAIEFEKSAKERSKICTKLHISRQNRRKCKDVVEEREEIVRFFSDPQHQKTLNQLTQLLGKVRKIEKYHADRTYFPRVKDN